MNPAGPLGSVRVALSGWGAVVFVMCALLLLSRHLPYILLCSLVHVCARVKKLGHAERLVRLKLLCCCSAADADADAFVIDCLHVLPFRHDWWLGIQLLWVWNIPSKFVCKKQKVLNALVCERAAPRMR